MQISNILVERKGSGCQCGVLTFRLGDREGRLLWIMQWRRAQKVMVEFVPGEGATSQDVRAHHERLVDAVVQRVFEATSRKALFG